MTYCSLLRGKVLLDFVSIKGTVSEDKWVREGQPHIICQCLKSIKNYGIVSQLGDTLALWVQQYLCIRDAKSWNKLYPMTSARIQKPANISVLLNLRHTLRIYRMAAVVVLARLNLVRQSFYARYEGKHPLLVKQLSKINIKIKFCSVDPHELY